MARINGTEGMCHLNLSHDFNLRGENMNRVKSGMRKSSYERTIRGLQG